MHINKKRLPGGELFKKVAKIGLQKTGEVVASGIMRKYGVSSNMAVTSSNLRKSALLHLDIFSKSKWDKTGAATGKFTAEFLENLNQDMVRFGTGDLAIPSGSKLPDDIYNFYWACEEFRKFWALLGFQPELLKSIIENNIQ